MKGRNGLPAADGHSEIGCCCCCWLACMGHSEGMTPAEAMTLGSILATSAALAVRFEVTLLLFVSPLLCMGHSEGMAALLAGAAGVEEEFPMVLSDFEWLLNFLLRQN